MRHIHVERVVALLGFLVGVVAVVMPFVGLSTLLDCAVPVRVWVPSFVPSREHYGNCDLTIRSIEDGADSTITTVCPAAFIVGNSSVTYDACHPNGKPLELEFRAAIGVQAPRGVGIAWLVGVLPMLILAFIIAGFQYSIADQLCGKRKWPEVDYQQLPSQPDAQVPDSTTAIPDTELSNEDQEASAMIDMSTISSTSHGNTLPAAVAPAAATASSKTVDKIV